MTFSQLKEEASKVINQPITDYRPAHSFYLPENTTVIDGHVIIPNAVICWLKDGSSVIYIGKEEFNNE